MIPSAERKEMRAPAIAFLAAALSFLAPMQVHADKIPGASGNRFQFEFEWALAENGQGALGFTIDDVYFTWSEQHPTDQSNTSANDCANIPTRPGANPNA
ncbi:MAG TPA: hypothetical protein VFE84_08910, partial [Patescibacteria group bacterium]|nr:hypothetical protein [Patescibacteria group bacterium]